MPELPCVRRGAVINTHNGNVCLCCGIEPETDERASGNSTYSPMCFTYETAAACEHNLHYPNEPNEPITEQD